ncbi:N-formylglutamate amidohydrolase [Microbacterium sp. H1-D42]|uniref:N-formylglutamate amidohydrolase n=1 Tax=Microbacterium sp. H1-D42 TaxID=2925844 RepID=UPI001F530188|nr:N-formylglutamate amidohydrolase [Microbacterium sp. H1-D42]UNK70582.1 N-formylglutamate amidohydrolase [Microbacterium sp. H1-D42]
MGSLNLIPAGHTFTEDDIVVYADRENRTLDDAIRDADILISCPHAGAAIPEELAEFLSPALTRRLQYDFTDVATDAIVRRWASQDPRVVAVLNPHPRLVRDPNRAKPRDVAADLSEAIARTAKAGPWQRVDLTGVDAIRPVTFSFFPILEVPKSEGELHRLVDTFVEVAERGLGVYERIRDDLTERFITRGLAEGGRFTRLSFHDTMNTTTTRDGAVNVAREPKDRLPQVVALSNRGDAHGEERTAEDPPTMNPARLRALAEAHRDGFGVADPSDVALNQPYLGSQEILAAGSRFRSIRREADAAGLALDAVQAEFLREYLLGDVAVAELHRPGTDWIVEDDAHVDAVAQSCRRAWDLYRAL